MSHKLPESENPHFNHRERVKERFAREGLEHFQPHQILEMILFYSIPRGDTNVIAHDLLKKFGSLSNVFEADPKDLITVKGIGENSATFLSMFPSVTQRYFADKWGEKPTLDSSAKAGEYMVSLFVGYTYEIFYVVCLDAQNKVNFSQIVQEGTIDEAAIYPREIVDTVLRHQAHGVILAHNHPGGSLKPSTADIDVTHKIRKALESISIHVIDHIIVAGSQYFSFAEKGLFNSPP